MVALYSVWYNFVRVHKMLRVTPAMAASVTDRLWGMEDIALKPFAVALRYEEAEPRRIDIAVLSDVVREVRTWAGATVG